MTKLSIDQLDVKGKQGHSMGVFGKSKKGATEASLDVEKEARNSPDNQGVLSANQMLPPPNAMSGVQDVLKKLGEKQQ